MTEGKGDAPGKRTVHGEDQNERVVPLPTGEAPEKEVIPAAGEED